VTDERKSQEPQASKERKKAPAKAKKGKGKVAKVSPLGYIPDNLAGRDGVSFAEVEAAGGISKVLGHLGLDRAIPLGGKNPVDRSTIEFDLSGDVNSKPVVRWRHPVTGETVRAYTDTFNQRNANKKWARIRGFMGKAVGVGAQAKTIVQDADRSDSERDSAAVISMIQQTGLRPGSKASAKGGRGQKGATYGVTTLLKDHVTVDGDDITLNFIGKSSKPNKSTLTDPELAAYVTERLKTADDRGGRLFDTKPGTIKAIMSESGGEGYTPKDFRTVVGTRLAAMSLVTHPAPPPPLPDDPKKAKEMVGGAVRQASKIVADRLNNLPATALKSYISPAVISSWVESVGGVNWQGRSDELLEKAEDNDPDLGGDDGVTERVESLLDNAAERMPYPGVEGEANLAEEDEENEPSDVEAYPLPPGLVDEDGEGDTLEKSGPFIGPRGGKWADAAHTIPYGYDGEKGGKEHVKALQGHLETTHGAKVSVTHRRGTTTLHMVKVPDSKRGKGTGNAVMHAITRHADKYGHTVALTAEPHGKGGLSKTKLKAWYKRHGFVDNKGRKKDYAIRESMYREPVVEKQKTAMTSKSLGFPANFDGFFGPGPLDLVFKGGNIPSGPGWQPVPGGKHGGYRRKQGPRWVYWYPSSAHAARAADHHKQTGERMRKKLGKVLRKRGAKQSDISKFLDHYDHHSEVGDAAHTHSQSTGGSTKDALRTALQDHHGLSDEQLGHVTSQLGKLISGMAGSGQLKTTVEDQGAEDSKKDPRAKKEERKQARDAVKHAEGQKAQDRAMLDHISEARAKTMSEKPKKATKSDEKITRAKARKSQE
jgi:DNA topoisomerase IB